VQIRINTFALFVN